MHKKNQLKSFAKLMLILILLAICAYCIVRLVNRTRNTVATPGRTSEISSKIDYSPPTDPQKNDSETHKDQIVQEQSSRNSNDTSGKKTVTPVITHTEQKTDGSVVVDAFVLGVVESGGVCTVRASRSSLVFTIESDAFANATVTNCKSFSIPRNTFVETGMWNFTVSYSSAGTAGTSQNSTQEVK